MQQVFNYAMSGVDLTGIWASGKIFWKRIHWVWNTGLKLKLFMIILLSALQIKWLKHVMLAQNGIKVIMRIIFLIQRKVKIDG